MESLSPVIRLLGTVLMTAILTACTALQDAQHKDHHPEVSPPQASGTMGGGMANGHMSSMDMQAMCDMHRNMMGAKTPEERQAMMDERMKAMSPEMMQQHMQMLAQQCK